MKKLLLTAVILLSAVGVWAQQNCVGFVPAWSSQSEQVSEKCQQMLLRKVEQIIARNNVGGTALYGSFAMYPELVVTDHKQAEGGMQTLNYYKGELTLFVANIKDNSNYGSVVVSLTGSGASGEQAMVNMIQSIKATDPVYTKFIKSSVQKIIDFYTNNLPTVIRQAETLMAQGKYQDAIAALGAIPICVPAYEQSAEAIKALAAQIAEKAQETTPVILPPSLGGAPSQDSTANSPALPTPNVDIVSPFDNVLIKFIGCQGNKNNQSVAVAFTFSHQLINQKFKIVDAVAYDSQGNKYECNNYGGSYGNYEVPTGVAVKATLRFDGILPSKVADFVLVEMTIRRDDANKYEVQKVNFRNVSISWK